MFESWQTAPATEGGYEKPYPMQQPAAMASTAVYSENGSSNYYTNGAGAYPPGYPNEYTGGYAGYSDSSVANFAGAGAGMADAASGMAGMGAGMAAADPSQFAAAGPETLPPVSAASADAAGFAAAAAAGGLAAGAVGAAAAPEVPGGLHDGMMVRVKVGFVSSLEDELAITQGQQLYLHNTYDDGWCLCEDDAHNRGVVPLSCLEPWQ